MSSNPSQCLETIQRNSELSFLYSYINASSALSNLLTSAREFTLLAPTNLAIKEWISSQGNVSQEVIDSTMTYHLLNGSFPSVSFTKKPQFVQSYLTNPSYSNVTIAPAAGQRVGILADSDESLNVLSGNISSITSKDVICLGGLIHLIDEVLSIPTIVADLVVRANLNYFVAILNRSNFLSLGENQLAEFISNASYTANMTFFVPNSQAALTRFSDVLSVNLTADELGAFFNYHIFPNTVAYSPSLTNGTTLRSQQGTNVTITTNNGDIYVNSAKVIATDYLAANGVLHVIDSILDHSNTSIPSFITLAGSNSSTVQKPMPTASASSTGLSTGAKIAIGVVIPVVVLALMGVLAFFFRHRKRKSTSASAPNLVVDSNEGNEKRELDTGVPVGRELDGNEPARELDEGNALLEMESPGAAWCETSHSSADAYAIRM
ncbi:hypothetical protein VTL71DRAFT_2381 [Oculimacula yallundae]|uniref:FAS1 domain-containing protein n=1 Tax=Oculimacula yallundae TaxID=86028 RepID=A0ABR4C979_9HELO